MGQTAPHKSVRQCYNKWVKIGAPPSLLEIIDKGFKIPLEERPNNQNPKPRTDQQQMITEIMTKWVQAKKARTLTPAEMEETRCWTPAFLTPKKGGDLTTPEGWRLITDLRAINAASQAWSHRPECWKHFLELLENNPAEFLWRADLRDFYHHVALHKKSSRWVRVKTKNQGWEVTVLPFGLAQAPQVSFRLSRPLVGFLRDSLTVPHHLYVDDLLVVGATKAKAEANSEAVVNLLTATGVQINRKKTLPLPVTSTVFLGHVVNLANKTIEVTKDKVQVAVQALKKRLKGNTVTASQVGAIAGMLLDMQKGSTTLFGMPRTLMREAAKIANYLLQKLKKSKHSGNLSRLRTKAWNLPVTRTMKVSNLFHSALQALRHVIPVPFKNPAQSHYVITCDSSKLAWGAVLTKDEEEISRATRLWNQDLKMAHSTTLEYQACLRSIDHFLPLLPQSCHLTLRTDCTSAAAKMRRGSSTSAQVNESVASMRGKLANKLISLSVAFIAGKNNVIADKLSRQPDFESYHLDKAQFKQVCYALGAEPRVDLFASGQNAQVKAYITKEADPKAMAQDAFKQDWSKLGVCWANPPFHLIARVLAKASQDKATLLLVTPVWRSKPWMAKLRGLQVKEPILLPDKPLYQGPTGESLPAPRWRTMVTLIQGR